MTETQQLQTLLNNAQHHLLLLIHNGRSKKEVRQQADRAWQISQRLKLAQETTHD